MTNRKLALVAPTTGKGKATDEMRRRRIASCRRPGLYRGRIGRDPQ